MKSKPFTAFPTGSLVAAATIALLQIPSAVCVGADATPPAPALAGAAAIPSPVRSWYLRPARIVWQSETGVKQASHLLESGPGQALLGPADSACLLTSTASSTAGILLDFGTEIAGSIEIFAPQIGRSTSLAPIRIRFGESAAETMVDTGGQSSATNDHAVRDQLVSLPFLGKLTVGPAGFRFIRIDAADPAHPVAISEIRAVLQLRDVPYRGSFRCDDERLNRIWSVGAYTVHLNMQDYLWDGIKRDRLVWVGDMHPEVSTIDAVFGYNEVVPRSLDLVRDTTPPTKWMNGISSYSMWWVLIHEQWWMHHGDRGYLEAQKSYLATLLARLAGLVGEDGREHLDGFRFLDWPSSPNQQGVTAGLQALLVMTLDSGERLMTTLGDEKTVRLCAAAAARGRKVVPEANGSKSGAALLVLAGMSDARQTADTVLKAGGPKGLSTFYGFYVLQALARSGDFDIALDFIRRYWGAMLDLGATTFWEDFDLDWVENAGRIDELVTRGKKDVHGDFGAYCYVGFRRSLCHGWASGPTAWLSEHVLGVQPLEPGCTRVRVLPQLGSLHWAEGSYPTPFGPIKVRHERQADGTVKSSITAPAGVTVVRQ